MFTKLNAAHIARLTEIVGAAYAFLGNDQLLEYGSDETEDLSFPPEIVLKPRTPEQISEILKFANDHMIPVTPMGARTGLSGGALPVFGGIALSMERFNEILHIDERNLQVTTEPGVITEVLQNAVRDKGLFYPPDPASRGSCFIGGNIAENSGGPKAVKYGVVKDYVLNLEVVLPTGEIIWTGANVLKNATGYNLTQLLVGSEGTLGVITKIVLRLIPHPQRDMLLLIPFPSAVKACAAVAEIFKAGITPSAMEFMEKDAILYVLKHNPDLHLDLPEGIEAHLLVEVDGNNPDLLMSEIEAISGIVEQFECGEVLFAESEREKQDLWRIRRKVGEAVKQHSVYKEEDTVVPRAELPQLLAGVKEIGAKYGFQSVCYGHAGDGNLHVNILKGNMTDASWDNTLSIAITEIFQLVKQLGGTISGEHGIGLVQKPYMNIVFDEVHLNLFRMLRKVFDPKGILNPGKVVD
ncbi:MAG TPA: FAD-linked oxidase C-terminal domain-containing protein [Chitinophagales bacterium]|nr:FAD-linked oxidase C-terminal domain-containing protein [Chitinophagales bacterium]